MSYKKSNPQLIYSKADLILKIQVVDGGRRKLFKADINILDKKEIAKVFSLLKLKFNMTIPKELKGVIEAQSAWDKLSLG